MNTYNVSNGKVNYGVVLDGAEGNIRSNTTVIAEGFKPVSNNRETLKDVCHFAQARNMKIGSSARRQLAAA